MHCRYSIASLMAAKHDYELRTDGYTHLHLDAEHMGVGGDDSWSPSCHQVSFCAPARFVSAPCVAIDRIGCSVRHTCFSSVQAYAVAPAEYSFSILLAPLLPNKEQTPVEAASQLWLQQCVAKTD